MRWKRSAMALAMREYHWANKQHMGTMEATQVKKCDVAMRALAAHILSRKLVDTPVTVMLKLVA